MEEKRAVDIGLASEVCPECGAVLASTQNMTGEPVEQIYACPDCGATFADLDDIRERLGLKAAVTKPVGLKPADLNSANTKPAYTKPADTKFDDRRFADTKFAETTFPAAKLAPMNKPEPEKAQTEAYDCPGCQAGMVWQQPGNESSGSWMCPACGTSFIETEDLRRELGLPEKK